MCTKHNTFTEALSKLIKYIVQQNLHQIKEKLYHEEPCCLHEVIDLKDGFREYYDNNDEKQLNTNKDSSIYIRKRNI